MVCISISGCFVHVVCMDTEVLLSCNRGVFQAMHNEGLEHALAEIVVSDSDPLLLV